MKALIPCIGHQSWYIFHFHYLSVLSNDCLLFQVVFTVTVPAVGISVYNIRKTVDGTNTKNSFSQIILYNSPINVADRSETMHILSLHVFQDELLN